ncbi:hypothetical protein F4X10_04245 [Candidatus Poribacteria bacterium]|nr:hypothetical protein [Candidatus Poribacteria bacterium]
MSIKAASLINDAIFTPVCYTWDVGFRCKLEKETGAGTRSRNTMRIRDLTHTPIILALGTERLYLKPTHPPAIVRWMQKHTQ